MLQDTLTELAAMGKCPQINFALVTPPWLSDLRLPLDANRLHLARSQMMLPCYRRLGQGYDYPDILEGRRNVRRGAREPILQPSPLLGSLTLLCMTHTLQLTITRTSSFREK